MKYKEFAHVHKSGCVGQKLLALTCFLKDHRKSALLVLHMCVQSGAHVCVCLCECAVLSGSCGSGRNRCEEFSLKTKGGIKQR